MLRWSWELKLGQSCWVEFCCLEMWFWNSGFRQSIILFLGFLFTVLHAYPLPHHCSCQCRRFAVMLWTRLSSGLSAKKFWVAIPSLSTRSNNDYTTKTKAWIFFYWCLCCSCVSKKKLLRKTPWYKNGVLILPGQWYSLELHEIFLFLPLYLATVNKLEFAPKRKTVKRTWIVTNEMYSWAWPFLSTNKQ